jgi:hypothetical protein
MPFKPTSSNEHRALAPPVILIISIIAVTARLPKPLSNRQHTPNPSTQSSSYSTNPYILLFRTVNGQDYYAFREDHPSILSDYPISFRGCYGCGETSHWQFKVDCKLASNSTAKAISDYSSVIGRRGE